MREDLQSSHLSRTVLLGEMNFALVTSWFYNKHFTSYQLWLVV